MKTLLAVILLIGFVSLAVFGFAEMPMMGEQTSTVHRTCLASAVQGINCPNEFGNFGSAFFHIAAFKFFSTLTLETTDGLAIFLAFLYLITTALIRVPGSRLAPVPISNFQPLTSHLQSPTSNFQLLLRWLALKELSPTR